MEFKVINDESPFYSKVLDLRQRILREPLGLNLYDEDLSQELNEFILIAYERDVLFGCVLIKILNKDDVKLRQMAIDTPYQEQGIGSELVRYAESVCKLYQYHTIELNARKPVLDFYRKLGYSLTGTEFIEVGIPHFKMVKNIRVMVHEFSRASKLSHEYTVRSPK